MVRWSDMARIGWCGVWRRGLLNYDIECGVVSFNVCRSKVLLRNFCMLLGLRGLRHGSVAHSGEM